MSEVKDWSTTAAGNAVAFDDIDFRDGFSRATLKTSLRAIMAAVRRSASGSSSLTPTNSAADITAINSAISGATTQSTILLGSGTFATTGAHTVPGAKILSFTGAGLNTVIQRSSGSSFLLSFNADPAIAVGYRKLEALTFDGNGPDETNPATSAQGVKIGSVGFTVHPMVRDCYFRRFGLGVWHYATQQSLVETTLFYRNSTGALYQPDDEFSGSTALTERKTVYQYNTVGCVLDKKSAFALATTGTLANSSTAVSSVGSVTGVTVGMTITGPGIRRGTTVAAVSAGSITLSQTTTSTAAASLVPILIKNTVTPVGSFPLYPTDGPVFDSTLFQGNFLCGLAAFSQDNVHLRDCYFESNATTGTTATVLNSARVVPRACIYAFNSTISMTSVDMYEAVSDAPHFLLAAGSRLRLTDTLCGAPDDFIIGDLTCSVEFFGALRNAYGRVNVPVARWPDSVEIGKGFSAVGTPIQTRTLSVANAFTGSARVPVFAINAGAITAATEQDSLRGPVRSYVFPATTGGIGSNAIATDIGSGTVTNGDQILVSVLIRADTYTNITAAITNGSYGSASLPVGPVERRLVMLVKALTTNSGVSLYLHPTGADGPKIYLRNMMQVVVPEGGDATIISSVLREGLINDGTLDGALVGTATYDPPSLVDAAGATTTVTVNGAALGMVASASFSLDTQGITITAWVSAANTVSVRFQNESGGTLDIASGTLRVRVIP